MNITHDSIVRSGVLLLLCLAFCMAGCEPTEAPSVHVTGRTMGTTYSVKVIGTNLSAETLQNRIDARLEAINEIFSTYIPTSELSRLNATTGDQSISPALAEVLMQSEEIYRLSDGAFDVTVGPLVNLWGFGPDGPADGIPAEEVIEATRARTGFDKVSLGEGVIRRSAPVVIDLSAIAKGYAVDEIALLLEGTGADRYLVEIGGEVRTAGNNARGSPWVIGVEEPETTTRQLQRTIPVRDMGMATSGDYRNYFMHEGRLYSHTIDPATGWPVSHDLASVTVLHERAAWADALATAFIVLGPAKSLDLAEQQGIRVFAILRTADGYKEVYSSAMQAYLAGIQDD